jgi:glycosyltransferase involved in cell wall biosynthesis
MRIVVLHRQFAHHSAHSGYGQVIRRQAAVEYLPPWSGVPARAADAVVRGVGRVAYSRTSVGFELAAARRMVSRPRAIYHVLYGEDDYHFLAGAAPVLRRLGGRLVATFHQPPDVFDVAIPGAVASRILPRLDAAVVTTDEQAAHLARWMPRRRIHHLPHGVDTAFFAPAGGGRPAGRPFTAICVGNWQRDFELLDRLIRRAHADGSATRFVVVAPPAMAARLGALPGVEAHTGVPDQRLRALYRESDALLLPLVQAAANNTLMEAMACGLPVVATDLPGVREYVGDAGARLIPRFDAPAAFRALADLEAEPELRARLGARSRQRALQLDFAHAAAGLADLYRAIA